MNTSDVAASKAPQMNWNLLRAFLAVVDAGSLTGGARLLAISQPTLSRQIADLEETVGVALFERVARGLRLTAAGEALIWHTRQMQTAAQSVSLAALGQTQQLAGTVRLTASEMSSAYVLPTIIAKLRLTHPEIQIELLASNRIENLLERQADIAIRHVRPTQNSLVARHIGDAKMDGYAHADYLARVGGHVDMTRITEYDWIGHDTSDILQRGFSAVGFQVDREFFAFRCDNQVVGWQMALAGLGIAFAPAYVAAQWLYMKSVIPEGMAPLLPIWLTAHRELRQSARIRVVFDALAEELQAMVR